MSGAHRVLLPEAWGKIGGGDRCAYGGGYRCWVQDFVAIDASRRAAVDMTMRLPRGYTRTAASPLCADSQIDPLVTHDARAVCACQAGVGRARPHGQRRLWVQSAAADAPRTCTTPRACVPTADRRRVESAARAVPRRARRRVALRVRSVARDIAPPAAAGAAAAMPSRRELELWPNVAARRPNAVPRAHEQYQCHADVQGAVGAAAAATAHYCYVTARPGAWHGCAVWHGSLVCRTTICLYVLRPDDAPDPSRAHA